MIRIPLLALLAVTACSQPQPQQLRTLTPESRKALASAELFARKLGMAGDCRTPGLREHYAIRDDGKFWVVDVEPPPRPGPILHLTIAKNDYKIVRAQKIG